MKRVGYWRSKQDDVGDFSWPEEGHLPTETKNFVGDYLRSGKLHEAWMGWSNCRICGKENGSVCLTDGEFVWPEGYIHYILDHNIMADSELLVKILLKK